MRTENERFWAAKSIINLNDNWFSEIPQHHIRQAAAAAAAAAPAVQHDSREIHQDMQRWPTCSAHNKKRMRRRHKRYIRIPGIYSPDDPNHALLQHRRGIIGYERDCRKEVHTESVVALSNSEGQTAGGTRERAGRVGVTKKAKTCSVYFFVASYFRRPQMSDVRVTI